MLNPNETKIAAQEFSYQKEVLSVGPIKFDHIWYVSLEAPSDEKSYDEMKLRLSSLDQLATQRVIKGEKEKERFSTS